MKFSAIVFAAAAFFAATAEARFGQEQAVQLGNKLQGAGCGTIQNNFSGQEIRTLLAAANPCDKLDTADAVLEAAEKACG
ncbi:hypothetical protein HDU97_009612, partial [Phlyctochytrium planicorne]